MWIPKTQVHYIDFHWGWVPKSLLKTAPTIQTKQRFHQRTEPQPHNWTKSLRNSVLYDHSHQQWIPCRMEKPKQEWRPKVTLPSPSTVISQFQKKSQVQKWIPKITSCTKQLQHGLTSTAARFLASYDKGLKSMCFWALNLQVKLFGSTLVLLPTNNWYEYVRKQQGYSTLASNARQAKKLALQTQKYNQVIQHQHYLLSNIVHNII